MIHEDLRKVAMDWLETSDNADTKALRGYTLRMIQELESRVDILKVQADAKNDLRDELHRQDERIKILVEYVHATEYWSIEPHDQKERLAHLARLKVKHGIELARF